MRINWEGIIGWIVVIAITYGLWNIILSAPLWVFFTYIIGAALVMILIYERDKDFDDDG
jgi:heme A synthase